MEIKFDDKTQSKGSLSSNDVIALLIVWVCDVLVVWTFPAALTVALGLVVSYYLSKYIIFKTE